MPRHNDNIKVYLGKVDPKGRYVARVDDPGSGTTYGEQPLVRLQSLGPNDPLGAEHPLDIIAGTLDAPPPAQIGNQRKSAEIGIHPLISNAGVVAPPIGTLSIDVLPARYITVRFYEVYSQNVPQERVPAAFLNVSGIVAELNDIYQQACTKFTGILKPPLQVPYDLDGDHMLQVHEHGKNEVGELFGKAEIEERGGNGDKKYLNVFIIHEFTPSSKKGLSDRDHFRDRCVVRTKIFESSPGGFKEFSETIAHEIGHLLHLSVHDHFAIANKWPDKLKWHDCGVFPTRYYKKDGTRFPKTEWEKANLQLDPLRMKSSLMCNLTEEGGFRWIRRDDWIVANDWGVVFED